MRFFLLITSVHAVPEESWDILGSFQLDTRILTAPALTAHSYSEEGSYASEASYGTSVPQSYSEESYISYASEASYLDESYALDISPISTPAPTLTPTPHPTPAPTVAPTYGVKITTTITMAGYTTATFTVSTSLPKLTGLYFL
jgi:hypothetical protein